jgi:hypothetical protein
MTIGSRAPTGPTGKAWTTVAMPATISAIWTRNVVSPVTDLPITAGKVREGL